MACILYRVEYTADVEGDWTDADESAQRFASQEEAQAWWDAHYRGHDDLGNQAYPSFVLAECRQRAAYQEDRDDVSGEC